MEIEILACIGCSRTEDQWTMCTGCKDCGGKLFRKIRPTLFRICCWIVNNPWHVIDLIKQDIREKYHA